jgi:hypothetical protein
MAHTDGLRAIYGEVSRDGKITLTIEKMGLGFFKILQRSGFPRGSREDGKGDGTVGDGDALS